jgi:hypothetical protein
MLRGYIAEIALTPGKNGLLSSNTQRAYEESLVSGWERGFWGHRLGHWQSLVIQPYLANLQPQFRREQCLFPQLELYRHLADVP